MEPGSRLHPMMLSTKDKPWARQIPGLVVAAGTRGPFFHSPGACSTRECEALSDAARLQLDALVPVEAMALCSLPCSMQCSPYTMYDDLRPPSSPTPLRPTDETPDKQ